MIQTQTEDYIIQLSDNMGNSKKDLLLYIDYFYGKMTEEYEDAEFLIQSQENVGQWIDGWNGDPDEICDANWKLREWKIGKRLSDGYEEANGLLMIDEADFVETYFVQRSGQRVLWELNRLLGEISVRELWEIHKEFPMVRVEYLG